MYSENYKNDTQVDEMYDWHMMELVQRPPYSHYDMIKMLADGAFMIEGKNSDFESAHHYATEHHDVPDVWEALKELDDREMQLAVHGKVW